MSRPVEMGLCVGGYALQEAARRLEIQIPARVIQGVYRDAARPTRQVRVLDVIHTASPRMGRRMGLCGGRNLRGLRSIAASRNYSNVSRVTAPARASFLEAPCCSDGPDLCPEDFHGFFHGGYIVGRGFFSAVGSLGHYPRPKAVHGAGR